MRDSSLKVLPFSVNPPERNMEIDSKLPLRAQKEGRIYLRWYGWNKLSLSFGYSQRKLFESFPSKVPKVLRPTGGGILIHGWDISFAIGTPSGVFKNFFHLYRFVALTFVETFNRLGVSEVSFSRRKRSDYTADGLCISFPTFGEVVWNNKKLVAAAVREFEPQNYLIHGSIYIYYNFKKAEDILNIPLEILQKKIAFLQNFSIKRKNLIATFNDLFVKKWIFSNNSGSN